MADVGDTASREEGWGVLDGLPGHPMMWVLIGSELAAFGLMLAALSVARAVQPAVFAAGAAQLDARLAGFNTLALVTSGWFAARGSIAARAGRRRGARLWLAGAIALGALFLALKGVEYAAETAAGNGLETSTFFTLYYLLTGFHALHVLLGMVILAVTAWRAEAAAVETGTAFWHMVDLVWLVVYPLIYLLR
ncbi:cytochrome c oxidase subunit 3 [Chelatococcus sp. SYSU_G07232]|uniref:Cytochrome c oxidase subunit 3 n=1 Tax=Chelatococcus albus TaxID=3047466 RepID=A0ABT7ADR1_9HYPH|nr:cytochrome c oxidase subunit 3 [Chelatococcus sp. SYSU_G07232]MDJ1157520.1 cytochrome c oxidase subunit 3 [Chelatococcus sp. SYSU_G07232]